MKSTIFVFTITISLLALSSQSEWVEKSSQDIKPYGLIHKVKGKLQESKQKLAKIEEIKGVLVDIQDILKLKVKGILADEIIEDLLTTVFISLKKSGLINGIVKKSLTDEEIRIGVISVTIELISADIIPYEEIFVALKDSGLVIDIAKATLTDPEMRNGTIQLVKEMVPELIKSGALNIRDLIQEPCKNGSANLI